MLHYRDNPKRPLFFYSFIQLILEVNGIVSKKEDLVEAPKILDESIVSNMRYQRDTNADYYYLEESGMKIYDDKVMEPVNDPSDESSGSSSSFLSIELKSYLDDLVLQILVDNQIR